MADVGGNIIRLLSVSNEQRYLMANMSVLSYTTSKLTASFISSQHVKLLVVFVNLAAVFVYYTNFSNFK